MANKKPKNNILKTSEIELRISLAKYLTSNNRENSSIFATEVRYGFSDRRADFVMINDCSHAFEIKSDFDTTARLEEQISEYISTFDFITVVTTPNYVAKIRPLIPKKVGLMVHKKGKIHKLRAAKQNKRLSKHHLTSSVTKERLIRELDGLKKNSLLKEAQDNAIINLQTTELRRIFLDELRSRFFASSQQFLLETDNEINEEDLLLLRRTSHLSF